ncbi:MAG: adventurous gliding motility protein GltC [Deltaproteobacteria bacterium]|nr:adventurous gliding motility protein GltC [Deltaproteobacteria bacterium]
MIALNRAFIFFVVFLFGLSIHAQIKFEGLDLDMDEVAAPKKKEPPKKTPKEKKPKKAKEPEIEQSTQKEGVPSSVPEELMPSKPEKSKAVVAPPVEEKKPAVQPAFRGAITFDALDLGPTQAADKAKMDKALSLMKQGEFQNATILFYEILADPKNMEFHQAAEYNIAKALYRMKKYYASLLYFIQIINKGTAHRFFQSSIEWGIFINQKLADDSLLLQALAKYPDVDFPAKYRDQSHFLLAKYYYEKDDFQAARVMINRIAENSPLYPKARYLEGIILYRENRLQDAVNVFRDVVKLTHPKKGLIYDEQLRENAFLQLARIHYQAGQFKSSVYYFEKVSRDSENWLESLFESSWAYFRMGDYEKALGNLVTLSSPFFKDEFFPEATIIKAVIYYDNCRYPEAAAFVDEFMETYQNLYEELNKIVVQKMSDDKYYELFHKMEMGLDKDSAKKDIKKRIIASVLSNKIAKKYNDALAQIDKEIQSISKQSGYWRNSQVAKKAISDLQNEKRRLMSLAGSVMKDSIVLHRDELRELIQQALRIQLEVETAKKNLLESKLKGQDFTVQILKKRYSGATEDHELYWPYEGEYWRDELGTYHYTMLKGCIK